MIPDLPICVIEPHADDAFLSLGWSIRNWVAQGRSVEIVTVFWPRAERGNEAKSWAASVGARWTGIGIHNHPERGFVRDKPLPEPLLPDRLLGPDVVRIWPLGLQHPDHQVVAALARPGELRYVDTPYQAMPDDPEEPGRMLVGRQIVWWHMPDRKKWEGVSHFPSQSAGYEAVSSGGRLEVVPEIIVR